MLNLLGCLLMNCVKGGTKETFVKDLEQSWRLYRLQALVFNVSWGLDGHVGRQARVNVVHFIVQFHPRRVWLYVKHLRWMLSEEYARLQETYIGIAPILAAAKSRSLTKPGPEDDIVKCELICHRWHTPNWTGHANSVNK